MKVIVGSQNPVKVEAVKLAFEAVWPQEAWEVTGANVSSSVSEQPMSHEEAITGARNRAHGAINIGEAEYGVGVEGGLAKIGDQYFNCGWVVVAAKNKEEGIGSTAQILTPPQVVSLVGEGLELGAANDRLFGIENSKQHQGHFGLMTNNLITRTTAYRDAVIVALSRFLHPALF